MPDLWRIDRIFNSVVLKAIIIIIVMVFLSPEAKATESIILTASWYSIESLKKEGTYKYSKGVMANGKYFDENAYTCATRLFPLGSKLRVTNLHNNKYVIVEVTDKIGKRFAKTRIDLSKLAFSKLDKFKKGLISVKVEKIK